MAWAFIADRGTANNKTSGTVLNINPNALIPSGRVIIVRCTTDANPATPTGLSNDHTKVEIWDGLTMRGTFTKIIEYTRTGNVTVSYWFRRTFIDTPTTYQIRLTLGTAVIAKVIGAEEFSYGGNQDPRIVGSQGADGSSTTPSVTLSGLVGGGTYLFLGQVGIEGPNGDTFTQDADYLPVGDTPIGTTGGGATSNMASRWGYRIATLSNDMYNPTLGTSRAWVDVLAALEEQTFVSSSGVVPWDGLGFTRSQRQVTDLFERTPTDIVAPGWTIEQPDNLNAGIFFVDNVDSGIGCMMEVQQSAAATGDEGFARRDERFGADEFAEVKIAQVITIGSWPSTYRVGIGVRCSGTKAAFTGYAALYRDTFGSQGVELRRFVGESLVNGGTVIGTWNGVLGTGQTWRLEVQGTEIRMKVGAVTVLTVQDTMILYWGQPAIVVWGTGDGISTTIMDFSRFTGGDLVLDWTLPYESLAPVTNTGIVPWESVAPTAGVSQTAEIPFEALALASNAGIDPWESLAQAVASGENPWESLATMVAAGMDPYEALAVATATGLSPWEALAQAIATGTMPWEALAAVVTLGVIPWETLMALASDGLIPWEAIAALQAVTQTASIPYESLAPVAATAVIPWESIKGAIQILLAVAMTARPTNLHWRPRPSTLRAVPHITPTYTQPERWLAVSAAQRDTTVAIHARQIALQVELRSATRPRDRTVVLAAVRRGTELATAHRDVAVRISQHTTDTKFVG